MILIMRDDFRPQLTALAPTLLEAATTGLLNVPGTLSRGTSTTSSCCPPILPDATVEFPLLRHGSAAAAAAGRFGRSVRRHV
ncbi:hypothetical protein ACFSNO_07245 [Streptomyces cirratus]